MDKEAPTSSSAATAATTKTTTTRYTYSSGVGPSLTRRNSSSIYDARIAGLYNLEQTIGKGHFAVVKLARHVFTGEKVAVKVIDKTKLDPVSRVHMMQEVRCMKLVQHPNVVRLYEVIDTQTKLFLILELGDYDMYDYIIKTGGQGVAESEAQRYFCQIIQAIDYCHKLHVVHRDLKPENVVFFEELGMCKLTDFGFSNLFTPGQQLDTSCGSLAYSAPEILLGESYDAPAVDVWSLGVILYMLTVGWLPFQEANDSETLTKILDCQFDLPDHLSNDCKRLIRRMLVRDPADRISPKEMLESPWVEAGYLGHADVLPLISYEHLPEVVHQLIVDQMVAGQIASADEIERALNADDYSYITATYYLLAEKVLSKQRSEKAKQLMLAKSEPRLDNHQGDGSTAGVEKTYEGVTVMCTCEHRGDEFCLCVRAKLESSATAPTPAAGGPRSTGTPRSRSNSWRKASTAGRQCSILKEESEEELSKYLRSCSRSSSRASSPATSIFGVSPGMRDRVSPQTIQEMLDLGPCSSVDKRGRRTPDSRRASRSPSPVSGRTSPSAAAGQPPPAPPPLRSFTKTAPTMRKLSSSPHLLGICEDREEDFSATPSAAGSSLASTQRGSGKEKRYAGSVVVTRSSRQRTLAGGGGTYSSVRSVRHRQAVVSPDVIRRYDRLYTASRRSTSCSSSEAGSDDDSICGRFSVLLNRRPRKGPDDDSDNDPPIAGGELRNCGGGGTAAGERRGQEARQSDNSMPASGDGGGSATQEGNTRQQRQSRHAAFDAKKLMGKLQELVIEPIREIPARGRRIMRPPEWPVGGWCRRLRKPKSCEQLPLVRACEEADERRSRRRIDKSRSPATAAAPAATVPKRRPVPCPKHSVVEEGSCAAGVRRLEKTVFGRRGTAAVGAGVLVAYAAAAAGVGGVY